MKFEGSIEFSTIEHNDDRVVSEMPIQAGIKNPFGVVHVGAILWRDKEVEKRCQEYGKKILKEIEK